jgi:glycosyltransferase involved in cell wall biosynthesis
MRIGLDLHTMTQLMQGSRTYIHNLIKSILELDSKNDFYLYFSNLESVATDPIIKQRNVHPRTIVPSSRLIRLPISFPLKLTADKIDAFHCQYMAPPLCPCPYLVSLHDIIHETHPQFYPPGLRFLMHHFYPISARRAAKVLTISQYSKSQITKIYKIPEEKIVVTYVGVSSAFCLIADIEKIQRVADKYGISGSYILFVGRIEPRKNLRTLIDAYHLLKRSYKIGHQLVIAGMKDPLFKDFHNSISAKGARDSVVFTGGVAENDLPYIYNGADLFVYPSFAEGFGLPVLEAMACGVPVITSNVTSLPEAVGDAGVMVPPENSEILADAMYRVLMDPGLQENMKQKGLRRAQLFSWRKTAEKVLEVYSMLR